MNGVLHSNDRPTETTALLNGSRTSHSLPCIAPILSSLDTLTANEINSTQWRRYDLTQPAETALALVILLSARAARLRKPKYSRDVWDNWFQEKRCLDDAQVLEDRIDAVWTEFLEEYRSTRDIEEVLWLAFPLTVRSHETLRVIDFIAKPRAPPTLLSNRIVYLTLLRTWKYGRTTTSPSDSWSRERLLCILDTQSTPRVLHGIDLIFQFAYLSLLMHYLIYPPASRPVINKLILQRHGAREILLLLLPLSYLARPWSERNVPFLIITIAFLSCLPTVPSPGDTAFNGLILGFAFHIYQLHLPTTPSPLFLLEFGRSLPLSTLLCKAISRIFYPALIFFLPVFLLSLFMLSFSLADTFLIAQSYITSPAPIQTRAASLFFLFLVIALLAPSLFILAIKFPTDMPASTSHPDYWDRYSKAIGLEAHRAFVQAVVSYSHPYTFSPPFNLLHLIAIRLPLFVLRICGRPPSPRLAKLERILWRITVGPIAIVVAGLWVWGLWQ